MKPLSDGELTGISDDFLHALYRWVVKHGTIPDPKDLAEMTDESDRLEDAIKVLEQLRLIRFTQHNHLVVVCPDVAESEVIEPMQKVLDGIRRDADKARTHFAFLRESYFQARRENYSNEAIDKIVDAVDLERMLGSLASRTNDGVIVSQSVHAPCDIDDAYGYLDRPLAERGVPLRRILPHSALSGPATQQRLRRIVELGTQLRTLPEVLDRIVVFDAEVAVLLDDLPEEGLATVIREPTIVSYLHRALEHQWIVAKPFTERAGGYGQTFDEIKLLILRLLAGGLKDEAIAKRVNLSVRTCRKHIAEIMDSMGATSRFQAGALARGAGVLHVPGPVVRPGPSVAPPRPSPGRPRPRRR